MRARLSGFLPLALILMAGLNVAGRCSEPARVEPLS